MDNRELKISVSPLGELSDARELLIIGIAENEPMDGRLSTLDQTLGGLLLTVTTNGDFTGKKSTTSVIYSNNGGPKRLCLVGLGKAEKIDAETVRAAVATAVKRSLSLGAKAANVDVTSFIHNGLTAERVGELLSEAAYLAGWKFRDYKTKDDEDTLAEVVLAAGDDDLSSVKIGAERGIIAAGATAFARKLSATPPNDLYPEKFAEFAQEVAHRHGWKCTAFDEKELKQQGLNLILAVGAGSDHPPRLIIIDSDPESKEEPVALIGKGITFDSGGISIKPSLNMHEMKDDMAGAGSVLAAADGLGRLGFQRRFLAVIASAENMPGTGAQRPADIVKGYDGTTVEVLNTDAEGRLVLADALAYVRKNYSPKAMIDMATLTGAVEIALGKWAAGLFSTDDTLVDALAQAGEVTYERVWRLPLFEEYDEQLKSSDADIQNIGGRPAGSITAAAFLKHFAGDVPWAHIDIGGTSWIEKERPYTATGPTGFGARLFIEFMTRNAG